MTDGIAEPAVPSPAGRRVLIGVVVGCLAVAAASLLVPATNSYDSWGWVVWGRDAARGELDTTEGPSWKPLPVVVTTALAPLGRLAPDLWLVVARAAALAALVGCVALGRRLSGWWAGVAAAALLVLSTDDEARFVRLALEGHTGPTTAALTVWAVERHLAGRERTALVLLTLLALDRPEAWPFLGLYALWLVRERRVPWWAAGGALGLVPVLWIGGELWGSGEVARGAGVARVYADDPDRVGDALVRVWQVVVSPTWWAALAAVVLAVRARDRAVLAVAAIAASYTALVVAMTAALGYAAVGRFLLPAGVLLCVLGGVGLAGLVDLVPHRWGRVLAIGVVCVLALPAVGGRVAALDRSLQTVAARGRIERDVAEVIERAGGPEVVARCGRVAIDEENPTQNAVASMVDLPIRRTSRQLEGRPGVVLDRRGTPSAERLEAIGPPRVEVLARTDEWLALAVDCPPAGPG